MEPRDWLTVAAIVFSALAAAWLTLYLTRRKERRDRKQAIFASLMATRAQALRGFVSGEQVRALNLIDIVFHGEAGAKRLLGAWTLYFDNLCEDMDAMSAAAKEVHFAKRTDLYVELLFEMGTYLKYSFDRALLRRLAYHPQGFIDADQETSRLKTAAVAVLEGRAAIGVVPILNIPPATAQAKPAPGASRPASAPDSPPSE